MYTRPAKLTVIMPVSSVTVAAEGGAAAVAVGGRLQMLATVLPDDAGDRSVTWSVINGTGAAEIDGKGLLTAISPGTVTARATANDGTGIYGERPITVTPAPVVVAGVKPCPAYIWLKVKQPCCRRWSCLTTRTTKR